jgi:hypothetical protein
MQRFLKCAAWFLGSAALGGAFLGATAPIIASATSTQASPRDCIVAAGFSGKLFTSADGLTWHKRSSGTTWLLNDAAATPERMVVVFGRDDPGSPILESTNGGQTWREPQGHVPAWNSNTLETVATDGHGWVTTGLDGAIFFSSDGEEWERATTPDAKRDYGAVAGNGSLWLAIGSRRNTPVIMASSDGRHWSDALRWTSPDPDVELSLSDVAWNGTQWIALGHRVTIHHLPGHVDGVIWTSDDGTHWTKHIYKRWYAEAVGWNGTEWLAIGYGVHASSDGVHWTKRSDDQGLAGIAWTGAQWAAVQTYIGDTQAGGAFVSLDGASWTQTLKKIGFGTVAAACTAT